MLKKILNELLSKLKEFVEICAALLKKQKYAKGGIVEPLIQKVKLEEGETIVITEKIAKDEKIPVFNDSFIDALADFGLAMNKVCFALKELEEKEKRKNTNNWCKMHGLPMRRRLGKRLKQ